MSDVLDAVFRLDGQVAEVTGAAQGIGKAVAQLFGKLGAKVVLADINQAGVEAFAESLQREGIEALPVGMDVARSDQVVGLFEAAVEKFGTVDILINNAGIFSHLKFTETTDEQWDHMHAVNTRGAFMCMREAVRHMKAGGRGGAIVNVSSTAAQKPTIHHFAHYASSKAGLDSLTKQAALEFSADGIRVNSVLPGAIKTEGGNEIAQRSPPVGPMMQPGRMPLGRYGVADDIAFAILYLASPASSYVTGQLLWVDGGFLIS